MFHDASVLAALTAVVGLWVVHLGATLGRREDIGATSLSVFAVSLGANAVLTAAVVVTVGAYGVTDAAGLATFSAPAPVELVLVGTTPLSGLLAVAAVLGWLRFVLTYTVRLEPAERTGVLAAAAGVFVVVAGNGLLSALDTFGYVSLPPAWWGPILRFGTLIEIIGMGAAIGGGMAQLYRASRGGRTFSRRAALALSLAVLLPYLTRYLYQFGLVTDFGTAGVLRLGSHTVALGCLWLAVEREAVFEGLPASRTVGRDTAFETAETAIAVLNGDDHIVDLNPAAESLFGVEADAVVGDPAATVLPPETLDAEQVTYEFPAEDRVVETRTTVTTDDRGRVVGRTVVYTDITGERRRGQRIEVLNRVLRHNLRNDANAVAGYADMAARGGEEGEHHASMAQAKLHDLVETGAKAREIEALLARDPFGDPTPLRDVVADAVPEDARVSVAVPDDVRTTVAPGVLRPVVAELVTNALEHGATEVEVRFDADAPALVVADDGPGIPEHEIEVFEAGSETPLKHGSGLGLWLVKWGVSRFGGELRFDTGASGSKVGILLPPERVERGGNDQT